MKTVLDAYEDKTLTLAKENSMVYNVKDHPDFCRGDMGKDKPKAACIYSLYAINKESRLAHVVAWDAWGGVYHAALPMHTLVLLDTDVGKKQDL